MSLHCLLACGRGMSGRVARLCQPQRNGETLARFQPGRIENHVPRQLQSGAGEPRRHLFGGNAEAAVGMVFAQFVKIMRREIDDEQLAVGLEDAACFQQGPLRLVEEVST